MVTDAFFLNVAKAFVSFWIDGLLFKVTFLHFPSCIIHTISSYLRGRTFQASFQTATTSRRGMRSCVVKGVLITLVLFSLYVNDMPSPLHHADLALYADDTAIIATSRKPTLLVSYMESYRNDLQRWLSEWRNTINVSESTSIIFALAVRLLIQSTPDQLHSSWNQ